MSDVLRESLEAGVKALGLELASEQIDRLLEFMALLQKWNKVYNLTAVRDPQEMLTHHLLDSLAAVAPLQRHVLTANPSLPVRLLDVGSGGGLPGVVFAICCPQVEVHCVDTVAKKAAFIQQAAATLRLPNLHGIHARVEKLKETFDVVSCRAFASLADFTTWSRQSLGSQAVWLAMKGKHPQDELAALGSDVQVFHVEPLMVPGLEAERCIIWMRPV
jgi:16S rRNA (guanine527-N7)-methyltransferase